MRVRKTVSQEAWETEYAPRGIQGQVRIDGKIEIRYEREKLSRVEILRNLLKYLDEKGIHADYYLGVVEPGYIDRMTIAADWNRIQDTRRMENWLEDRDIAMEWSDEWAGCTDCGKAVRTCPDSYSWTPSFVADPENGDLVCRECAENAPEWIVDVYGNRTDRAIPPWGIAILKKIGFRELDQEFEIGYHPGQNDTPEKVLEDVTRGVGREWFEASMDYVCMVECLRQFDMTWKILVREREGVS